MGKPFLFENRIFDFIEKSNFQDFPGEYTFSLMHNFKWSLTEFENMLPWERDIYISKLEKELEEEKQERDNQEQNQTSRNARLKSASRCGICHNTCSPGIFEGLGPGR